MTARDPTASSTPDLGTHSHLNDDGTPKIVERRFLVELDFQGFRLDHYLKAKIPRLSRTKLQTIIRTQLTREPPRPARPNSRVTAGETLTIRRPARPEPPCPRDFRVVFEDEHVMVIDKPAGLPMHASAKFYFNTLTRVIAERFPNDALQICHRLDRETSGLVVLARGKQTAAQLKGAFANKIVRKHYLAVVHGQPPWTNPYDIDLGLKLAGKAADISIRMVVDEHAPRAVTRVQTRETRADYALVDCAPITGRQHQIRAHLAAAGFPIVGDKLYAHGDDMFIRCCDGTATEDDLLQLELPRHALHAARIAFPHPATDQTVTVDSVLPEDLHKFFNAAPRSSS